MLEPDLSAVSDVEEAVRGADDPQEAGQLLQEATRYLLSFEWCYGIKRSFSGIIVPGVIGVFLYNVVAPQAKPWIWVVVGDIPPAYISTEGNPIFVDALAGYVYEMDRWIDAVRNNSTFDAVYPVSAPRTAEYADMLDGRLRLIEQEVILPRE